MKYLPPKLLNYVSQYEKPNGKVVCRSVQCCVTQLEDPQLYTPNNCEDLVLAYNAIVMELSLSFVKHM